MDRVKSKTYRIDICKAHNIKEYDQSLDGSESAIMCLSPMSALFFQRVNTINIQLSLAAEKLLIDMKQQSLTHYSQCNVLSICSLG